MKKILSILLSLCIMSSLAVIPFAEAAVTDEVLSEDFENGELSGWSGVQDNVTVTDSPVNSGTGALFINPIKSVSLEMTELAVEKNTDYFFSAYVYITENIGNPFVIMISPQSDPSYSWDKRLLPSLRPNGGIKNKYQKLTSTFNSGDNDFVRLRIWLTQAVEGQIYIDDIRIVKREPRAENVEIDGACTDGFTVSAKADIVIPVETDTLVRNHYSWEISEDGISYNEESDEKDFNITADMAGKYIRVGVKPEISGGYMGKTVYSPEKQIVGSNMYKLFNISGMYNSSLFGSILIPEGMDSILNASNIADCSDVSYGIYRYADKNALTVNGSGEINIGGLPCKNIYMLGGFNSISGENARVEVKYINGTSDTREIQPLSIYENNGTAVNDTPIGMVDDENKGYLYSFKIKASEDMMPVESVVIKTDNDDTMYIAAVTLEQFTVAELKNVIEAEISSFESSGYDTAIFERITNYINTYKNMGGDIHDISNYDIISEIGYEKNEEKTINGVALSDDFETQNKYPITFSAGASYINRASYPKGIRSGDGAVMIDSSQNKYGSIIIGGFEVTPNTDYDLSIYVSSNADVGNGTVVAVSANPNAPSDNRLLSKKPSSACLGNWEHITGTFNSGDSSILYVRAFISTSNVFELYFDDIDIKACSYTQKANIDGPVAVGQTVSADYICRLTDTGEEIKTADAVWQISSDGNADWTDVSEDDKYTFTEEDTDKYVRLKVLPKTESGSRTYWGISGYSDVCKVAKTQNVSFADLGNNFNSSIYGYGQNGIGLSKTGFKQVVSESNIIVAANDINYYADYNNNNAVKISGNTSVNFEENYYEKIGILGTGSNGSEVVTIKYSDGSSQTEQLPEASADEESFAGVLSAVYICGSFITEEMVIKNKGIIYSYEISLDKMDTEVSSINISGDGMYVLGISGMLVGTEEFAALIDGKIEELGEITIDDNQNIIKVSKMINTFKKMGGNIGLIKNYSLIQDIIFNCKSGSVEYGLYDTKVRVMFDNPAMSEDINAQNISVSGTDKNYVDILPVFSGNDIVGVDIAVMNNFEYKGLSISISKNVRNSKYPYVEMGEDYNLRVTPKAFVNVTSASGALNGLSYTMKADIENKLESQKNAVFVTVVYNEKGNIAGILKQDIVLVPNEPLSVSITGTISTKSPTAVNYIFDSMDSLNMLYASSLSDRRTVVSENNMYVVKLSGAAEEPERIVSAAVYNDMGDIIFIGAGLSGKNGLYQYEADFNGKNVFGEYKTAINGYGFEKPLLRTVYFPTEEELNTIVSEMKEKEAFTAEEITAYAHTLNADGFELADKIDKSQLARLVKNGIQASDNAEDIRRLIKKSAVIASYNNYLGGLYSQNGDFVYADELGLNSDLYDIFRGQMTETGKVYVQEALQGKNFISPADFDRAFAAASILNGIRYTTSNGVSYVENIITDKNGAAANHNFKAYTSYNNKSLINSYIARTSNATLDELDKRIENAIKNAASGAGSNERPGGGSGGSGGGSGSGNKNVLSNAGADTSKNVQDMNDNLMFTDVPDKHWAYDAIYFLTKKMIVSGKSRNEFAPDDYITREEIVKLICEAFNIAPTNTSAGYIDVQKDSWYEPYINAAAKNGIAEGIGDNCFGVGQPVTRQDICVLIARASDAVIGNEYLKSKFTDDENIAGYAKSAVTYLADKGIISGFEDASFRPTQGCTRAQAAKIIYELIKSEVK